MGQEQILEQIKDVGEKAQAAIAGVKKSHETLDGRLEKIEKSGADAITKDAFQQEVERVEKSEKALDDVKSELSELQTKMASGAFGVIAAAMTLGALCVDNDVAKNYDGGNAVLGKYQGPLFGKAVTSGDTSAGAVVTPHRVHGIIADAEQALTIRDLLTVLPISTNSVEYVVEKEYTNNAGPQSAEGEAKNESNITFEAKDTAVKTIAHWVPVSRQILADAPSLQAFIDMRLRYGLKLAEEGQLLKGDGTGGALLGLMPQATAFDTAKSKAGDSAIDQIRRSLSQSSQSGYPATGVIMTPDDWCDIELTKTTDNAYLFANPTNSNQTRLWGKRVVESMSMTAKDYLVGSFGLAATLWDREDVTVRVAEQHADFFVKNMVALLCEAREALTVERPSALVKGTFA